VTIVTCSGEPHTVHAASSTSGLRIRRSSGLRYALGVCGSLPSAELEARTPEDQPEVPDGTQEARRPTPNRVPSDRPAASTGLLPEPCTASQADSVTGITVPAHTVGYQDLGGYVYEIAVAGRPPWGTVSPVGRDRLGGYQSSRHGAWLPPQQGDGRRRLQQGVGGAADTFAWDATPPRGDEKGWLADSVRWDDAQPRVVQAFAVP
jgi:hypothetical protein